MALGSTQPLTEMSTRSISWGKGGRCVRLTNLPPSCAVVKKSGNLNFLETSGPLQACNGAALPLPYHHTVPLSRNLGTLTSWNPLGHSRPVTGLQYLYLYIYYFTCLYFFSKFKEKKERKKVKQSRYRSGVAQRVPER
jgi:hypothetical protein